MTPMVWEVGELHPPILLDFRKSTVIHKCIFLATKYYLTTWWLGVESIDLAYRWWYKTMAPCHYFPRTTNSFARMNETIVIYYLPFVGQVKTRLDLHAWNIKHSRTHACTHIYVYKICMYICIYVYMYICIYVYMYICILYVCMYVCMYVYVCVNGSLIFFFTWEFSKEHLMLDMASFYMWHKMDICEGGTLKNIVYRGQS